MKRTIALLAIGLISLPRAEAVEVMRWERLPLAIALVVNQERTIFLDKNVRVGVPNSLRERLRIQSAGGALYLRAGEPIEPTRIQLQDVETGELILLDVTAEPAIDDQPPLEPVRIVDSETQSRELETGQSATDLSRKRTPQAVVLTQHAAQSLYSPLRTIEAVENIVPVSVRPDPLDTLLPHLSVSTRTLAAWRLDDLWVTAVKLTNRGQQPLPLDPRVLQGNFVAATFQHRHLGPAGNSTDTTVVYLVTKGHGINEALLPNISPIDASAGSGTAGNAGTDNAK